MRAPQLSLTPIPNGSKPFTPKSLISTHLAEPLKYTSDIEVEVQECSPGGRPGVHGPGLTGMARLDLVRPQTGLAGSGRASARVGLTKAQI